MRILAGLIPFGSLVAAQAHPKDSVQVLGRVADSRARDGRLGGVEVIVNRRTLAGTTDSLGRFAVTVARTDSSLAFRRIGYRPVVLGLRPLPPPGEPVLVLLDQSSVDLPEIIVTAAARKPLRYAGTTKYDDFFRHQRVGFGTFRTRDDLDRRFVITTPELLQGIPGVRLSIGPPGAPGSNLKFVRCPQPSSVAVFIDGARQMPAGGPDHPVIEMLNRINPADIEMMEVYRGAAEIPGEYHWDGCAVVAVWTKQNR